MKMFINKSNFSSNFNSGALCSYWLSMILTHHTHIAANLLFLLEVTKSNLNPTEILVASLLDSKILISFSFTHFNLCIHQSSLCAMVLDIETSSSRRDTF